MDIKKNVKNAKEYICNKCDFKCSNHYNYTLHLSTDKHQKICNGIIKVPKQESYICLCGKEYKHNSGLWRHKKTCL